jgi:hypothetical protein
MPVQERVYGIGKPREIAHVEPFDRAESAIGQESESGIRRPNITQQDVITPGVHLIPSNAAR